MKLKRVSLVSIVEFLFVVSVAISGGTMYGVMDSFYVKGINDFTLRILCMAMSCVLIGIYIINKRIAITRKQALFFSFSVLYFALLYSFSETMFYCCGLSCIALDIAFCWTKCIFSIYIWNLCNLFLL